MLGGDTPSSPFFYARTSNDYHGLYMVAHARLNGYGFSGKDCNRISNKSNQLTIDANFLIGFAFTYKTRYS